MTANLLYIEIVDDDQVFAELLEYQLRSAGFDCRVSLTSGAMEAEARTHPIPDLYLVDYWLGSEKSTGIDVCRRIVSEYRRPVIILTANDDRNTAAACLEAGAHDYVVKPYSLAELLARIHNVTKRFPAPADHSRKQLVVSKIRERHLSDVVSFDPIRRRIFAQGGECLDLTEKETQILELICSSERGSVSRFDAYRVLYGYDMEPGNRSIDVLISRIRKKLGLMDNRLRLITVRGEGYELQVL